jgi:hypothetical protein
MGRETENESPYVKTVSPFAYPSFFPAMITSLVCTSPVLDLALHNRTERSVEVGKVSWRTTLETLQKAMIASEGWRADRGKEG